MIRLPGSIRLNLVLVVLAGVLPVLAVVLGSGLERREHEIVEAGLTTLRLAEYYAHQQEVEVARIRTILAALAEDKAVRSLDVEACNRIFRNVLIANPNYANFALMDKDGEALASSLAFNQRNLSDRKDFIEAKATNAFAVGEYVIGRVSMVPVLPFAHPVHDEDGRICGVLIATLRLQNLASIFDQARLPKGSFVGLADRDGRRLYRYPVLEQAIIGQPIGPEVWARIHSADRQVLFTETSSDGIRRIYAVRRVSLGESTPYLNIFVGIPEQGVIAQADAVTRSYLIWLTGSLLLSICLAWLVGRYGIHKRVTRIVQVAQRLGEGDLSIRSGFTETNGSLGLLARSMDNMAQALESDRNALVQAKEARDIEAQRRAALMDLSPDGIVIIDKEYRVVEANRRFSEMLGYARNEEVGLYTWDYDAMTSVAETRSKFPSFSHAHTVFESQYRRVDSTTFPVEVSIAGSNIFGESLTIAIVR